jgi:hypothetical protein
MIEAIMRTSFLVVTRRATETIKYTASPIPRFSIAFGMNAIVPKATAMPAIIAAAGLRVLLAEIEMFSLLFSVANDITMLATEPAKSAYAAPSMYIIGVSMKVSAIVMLDEMIPIFATSDALFAAFSIDVMMAPKE